MMKMHDYQLRAAKFVRDHTESALFLEMGLGKTISVLSAMDDLIAGLNINAVLVVAPIRVVESVWPDEVEKWDHTKHLKISLVRGSAKQRAEALKKPAQLFLINYELLPWLADLVKKWKSLPFDMIVFDESSKMKSPRAKRFKKIKRLLPRFKRRVIMTGTPAPNSYLDLWAQVYCADVGRRLGGLFDMFKDRWFTFNQYTYECKIKPGAQKAIRKRIADMVLCMSAKDYLKLPPYVENEVRVKLPPKVMKQYKEFEKELYLKLCDTEVEAFNAASLSMKCRQLTSGAIYDMEDPTKKREGERKWTKLHDVKLDALQDIIDEAQGESVLVVYEFKHELARLRKRYPKAPWIGGGSKNADKAIREWNARKHRVMLVHAASVGHGINLQAGGRIMVWTSMTWSYELFAQMVKRLHRQGQLKAVMIHLIIAAGTVDEDVRAALLAKHTGQATLMHALRARLKKRLSESRGRDAPGGKHKRCLPRTRIGA